MFTENLELLNLAIRSEQHHAFADQEFFHLCMVFATHAENILEYGTRFGFSACLLAYAQKKLLKNGKVYSVDMADQSEAKSWADRFHLRNIEFTRSLTWDYTHSVQTYDYIFLDASHDYEGWKKELISVFPYVTKHTLIAVHDTPESADWKRVEKEMLGDFQSLLLPHLGMTLLSLTRGADFPLNFVAEGRLRLNENWNKELKT
jgi:predicted O-methyltransferase YrrM